MSTEREVRLFRNGRNQAVRIPREFELPGTMAVMYREGERLVIAPRHRRPGLLEVLATLTPDDFVIPLPADPPPESARSCLVIVGRAKAI